METCTSINNNKLNISNILNTAHFDHMQNLEENV